MNADVRLAEIVAALKVPTSAVSSWEDTRFVSTV